ncbi:peptidase M20 domain-containing protein 2 isoform X3 [Ictalurus punctatus]|nr:peptidase M20 domain-containing protein 2 isoform X3 [Ictalurus punctatus]XP_017308943.1 peptidase M20 domain-containing protein 2 isoform X3 [Ictalurus punctatus]XP_053543131.1 peptidase M20 domain-containing protein 2 isoform X3 [Ictalurus punctatus]
MADKLRVLKQQVCCSIDKAKDKLHGLGDAIWHHPELAYEERQAHDTLVRFFTQEQGWTVEAHYKLETAFQATWGPVSGADGESVVNVGFLCEYDALPAIGHACGHNLIAECGAAAAVGLKAALESRETWPVPIKVTVLGTPAEEDGGGKVDLLQEGVFEDLDVVFMAHPSQEDATYIPDVAEHDLVVKYHGRASHASAYPWEGVNALDAAVLAYSNMSVLRQQLRPDWRVHGIIRHGGAKPNIIPDYSELEYYLRTPSHRDLPKIKAKAEACFQAAALATGCRVELLFARNEFYEILRNHTLEGLYEENGKSLGMKFITVKDSSGSTDFGNVTHAVPGIHPYFYIGSEALNHTTEYTAASGANEAQFYTLRTAKALAMTALDVIFSPGVLDKVKKEFKEAKLREERGLRLQQAKHGEAETNKEI